MVCFDHIVDVLSLTLYTDGAGLAAGVFNHLLLRGNDCPKVLAATHFHGSFNNPKLQFSRRLTTSRDLRKGLPAPATIACFWSYGSPD